MSCSKVHHSLPRGLFRLRPLHRQNTWLWHILRFSLLIRVLFMYSLVHRVCEIKVDLLGVVIVLIQIEEASPSKRIIVLVEITTNFLCFALWAYYLRSTQSFLWFQCRCPFEHDFLAFMLAVPIFGVILISFQFQRHQVIDDLVLVYGCQKSWISFT